MTKYYQIFSSSKIKPLGARGIVYAIILRAQQDATAPRKKHRTSALEYFRSGWYIHHLEVLGLPTDLLPVGIKKDEQ